jgi:hypothetical protein
MGHQNEVVVGVGPWVVKTSVNHPATLCMAKVTRVGLILERETRG